MRQKLSSLSMVVALCAGTAATAADPAPVAVSGCQACHGVGGVSPSPSTPNLAGQKRDYLAAQLAAFKSGARKHDVMSAIASQLADEDMKSLAAYWSSLPATLAAGRAPVGAQIRSRSQLPADFPSGFTVYETIDASNGFVVKRFANAPALAAARAGHPLPSGSMIVVANYARQADGKPGAAQGYSVMESRAGWGDAIPALLRNGDWDYALFDGAKVRQDQLNQAQCLACHRPAAADSYVFTLKTLKGAASR